MQQQLLTYELWKGPRRDTFALSMVLHTVAVAALVALAGRQVVTVQKVSTGPVITLVAPTPLRETKVMPPRPKVMPPPQVVRIRPAPRTPPVVTPPKVETTVAKVDLPPMPQVKAPQPAPAPKPPQQVKTGGFDPPKNTVVTTNKPAHEVQTGGFGDPNGVPGQGKPNAAANIATLGSFDLPGGPGAGNGSGGRHGVRGTIASAGFGTGVSGPNPGPARGGGGSVTTGGFGDATVAVASATPKKTEPAAPKASPVEIFYKPRPLYTAEARSQRIEGEVLLDVKFAADGRLEVVRVVRGLGHGLDEAAIRAARQIRFRPATRDGQPCDSAAVVHIVFQLAG